MTNKYIGSEIDDFLKEEGVLEEFQAKAVKEVIAWQVLPHDVLPSGNIKPKAGRKVLSAL